MPLAIILQSCSAFTILAPSKLCKSAVPSNRKRIGAVSDVKRTVHLSAATVATDVDSITSLGLADVEGKWQRQQEEESAISETKVGVLLLNLGGPEKSEDVEGEI